MLERKYQTTLIDKIEQLLPGCFVLKNDSSQRQGIPDLLVLFEDRWAMLEVKRNLQASYQPNQEFYIDVLNKMSYAASICPENEGEVLSDLQHALTSRRNSRVSKRK